MPEHIHATAVIDRTARIGRGVVIGAYSIVGPDVTLGDEVEIGHHVVLEGTVVLDAHVKVGHGSIVGAPPQDLKYRDGTVSGVRIGARTVLREHVTVHRPTTPESWTMIGADGLLMTASHVAHDCRVGDGVIMINSSGLGGHCDVGDRATIGAYSGLHPFTRVGESAYIGGMSKVVSDVPPYLLVDGIPVTARGVNVIGLRRAGMPPAERRALQDAFRILYRSGLAPAGALDRMRHELQTSPAVRRLIAFVEASKRGICHAPRLDARDEADVAAADAGGGF